MNEGLIKSLLGAGIGVWIGPKVGKIIAKILGIEKGLLYNFMTSNIVGAALGYEIANLNKSESGGSSSTLPASLNGIPPIRTPREDEIIKNTYGDLGPRGNPFLQNGMDDGSVNTALSSRGADLRMDGPPSDIAGITVGHGTV
jgi:hypothetical protein